MTDQIPAAGSLDSRRRDLKHRLAAAEVEGDTKAVKQMETALGENAAAKEAFLRKQREEIEAAAAARKAAAEDSGDPEAAAKTPPAARSAGQKNTTDKPPAK